jgi:YggT family protein
MASQVLVFLLQTFLGLFSLALLLRFYLQAVRAPTRNPLSQFVAALTDFVVRPARRVVPGLWGFDMSTLVLAWATELLLLLAIVLVSGSPLGPEIGRSLLGLVLMAALNVFRLSVYILIGATIALAVLSFVAPTSPAMPIANALTRPFLQPFRRRIPPIGNVDLSPLFLLVACQLILMVPVRWVEDLLRGLL